MFFQLNYIILDINLLFTVIIFRCVSHDAFGNTVPTVCSKLMDVMCPWVNKKMKV